MWPSQGHLLAVGTPAAPRRGSCDVDCRPPNGPAMEAFQAQGLSSAPQPSTTLTLDTEPQASLWPVGPWAPQLTPSSRHPYLPPEAAQGLWCPLLCCPPRGLGQEQPRTPARPLHPTDRSQGSWAQALLQPLPATAALVSTSTKQEGGPDGLGVTVCSEALRVHSSHARLPLPPSAVQPSTLGRLGSRVTLFHPWALPPGPESLPRPWER